MVLELKSWDRKDGMEDNYCVCVCVRERKSVSMGAQPPCVF